MLKSRLKSLAKLLQKYPKDPCIRGSFIETKKFLKSLIKKAKKQFKNDLLEKIWNPTTDNTRLFWSTIKQLRDGGNKAKCASSPIPLNEWYEHYKQLHADNSVSQYDDKFKDYINSKIRSLDHSKNDILDPPISTKEIENALNKAKNNKACGLDNISNEFLKYGRHALLDPLQKLFNLIHQSMAFPSNWSQGYITPCHKKGSTADKDNYRGLSITSCVGKLYTYIVNNRLVKYLTQHKKIDTNQIGFLPKHRTSDHIYVLDSIVKNYKSRRKPVFACFVDLRKAFDSVWQAGLLYKLQKHAVGSKFISIIQSMYSKCKSCVKINGTFSPFFDIKLGTRQGCNLSPMLFDIYINDLSRILQHNKCDPVYLGSEKITSLLYADDLVLLSESPTGLQRSINSLSRYCRKWRLNINTKKTQTLIFNKKSRNHSFTLNNEIVQNVKKYTYLGITFSHTGSFSEARKVLQMKAQKALWSLFGSFDKKNNRNIPILLKLFDSLIKPILLYGSEIWGASYWRFYQNNSTLKFLTEDNSHFEHTHLKFCKQLLGVNPRASNLACRGDLGRFPLSISVTLNIVKFWKHLIDSDKNSLAWKAYIDNVVRHCCGQTNDVSIVSNIFNDLNNQQVCNNTLFGIKGIPKHFYKALQKKMITVYQKFYFSTEGISANKKLDLYCLIKKLYKKEQYLSTITEPKHRYAISQLRFSAHPLPIEAGRNRKLARTQRICQLCRDNAVGDELHTILHCTNPKIQELRVNLFEQLNTISQQFQNLNDQNKLVYLCSMNDDSFAKKFSAFIYEIFQCVTTKRNF